MTPQQEEKLMRICQYIRPNSKFHNTPFKCGSDTLCDEIFQYAGVNYCGRMFSNKSKREMSM